MTATNLLMLTLSFLVHSNVTYAQVAGERRRRPIGRIVTGIVLGILAFLCFCTFFFLLMRRRRARLLPYTVPHTPGGVEPRYTAGFQPKPPGAQYPPPPPDYWQANAGNPQIQPPNHNPYSAPEYPPPSQGYGVPTNESYPPPQHPPLNFPTPSYQPHQAEYPDSQSVPYPAPTHAK